MWFLILAIISSAEIITAQLILNESGPVLDLNSIKNATHLNDRVVSINNTRGRIFRGLFGPLVEYVIIANSDITDVEDGAFCAHSRLEAVELSGNRAFPIIEKKMFGNCSDTLLKIDFRNVSAGVGAFENLNKLILLNLFNVNFSGDLLTGEHFKGLSNASIVRLVDVSPRKISDDALSSLPLLMVLTIEGRSVQESPELSDNTLKDLKLLRTFKMLNFNTSNVKWHRMENLVELTVDGPHEPHENERFFQNFRQYFPLLEKVSLNRKYYVSYEIILVKKRLQNYNIHLEWI